MSHCEYRLLVQLNGLKIHLYNRTELYCQLEKYFGLETLLLPDKKKEKSDKNMKEENRDPTDMSFWNAWRDLIPVVKFQMEMVSKTNGNSVARHQKLVIGLKEFLSLRKLHCNQ